MRLDDDRVMDPATVRARIWWIRVRRAVLGAALMAIALAFLAVFGSTQQNALIFAEIAAISGGALILALALFGPARPRPTVQCARCGVLGWSADLRHHSGRCPRCNAQRFYARGRYRAGVGGTVGDAEGLPFNRIEIPRATQVMGADIAVGDFLVAGEGTMIGAGDGDDNGNGD